MSMQNINLSDKSLFYLRQVAALRGLDIDTCAEELLTISLAVLHENNVLAPTKSHRAMEFSAIAPTGRTAKEIDTEIEADRESWDIT